MKLTKLTKHQFHDIQYDNRPLGAFYYIQELDEATLIFHGLIITNRYQLFAEFTRFDDLENWVLQETPPIL